MTDRPPDTIELESAGTALFDFAVDRNDLAWLLARWPAEAAAQRSRIEYELQLLKTIAVGWSLSYYLEGKPCKQTLMEFYWQAVGAFANQLSTATALTIGPTVAPGEQKFDYFQVIKDRLRRYLAVMTGATGATGPEMVIGPEFARICDNADDPFTLLAGTKMFAYATARVGEYLKVCRLL